MHPETVYHIPGTLVLFLGMIVVLFLVFMRKRFSSIEQHVSNDPDWSVPAINTYSHLHSPFHSWDPRIKISSLVLYCFVVVSIENISIAFLLPIISLVSIRVSNIPFYKAMYRMMGMAGFLSMFLVIIPLTVPLHANDAVVIVAPFDTIHFNLRGLHIALLIILKACGISLMMEPLLNTAPLPTTINALAALKLPNMVGQMILLSHRYIFVFLHEARRMTCGMQLRGFQVSTDIKTLKALGNFLGMLFVRSFDRTQRVYDAMLSRGYTGNLPTYDTFSASFSDWVKGAFWISLGITQVIVDRMIL